MRALVSVMTAMFAVAIAASSPKAGDAAPDSDIRYRKPASNPALYELARKYFTADDESGDQRRIFRLTRDQIDTSVATLLPGYVTQSIKATMPRDPLQTNYEYAEILSFNAANLGALSTWIADIAARVRQKPRGVIECPGEKPADDCLKPAAAAFIAKAFRGDLTPEKSARLLDFFSKGVKSAGLGPATGDLVEVVLNSPDFLFRKEIDIGEQGRLKPQQLLQALTYMLADAPPEKVKLASVAASDRVASDAELRRTIADVLASKEAREKVLRFFHAWLEIKDPSEFTISDKTFPEFNATFASAMLEETDRFLKAQLEKPRPRLSDITQSNPTFATRMMSLDPTQRLGIFSQPAVIASHSGPTNTRLVKRGVFWVRKVMCMELEPPPPGIDLTVYDTPHTTERQRLEQSTAKKACIGCHKIIDPFGFALENYDALGRWRTEDNGQPIDAKVTLDFLDEPEVETNGPVDALRALTSSAKFKQCFVRQAFRFYMGRQEKPSDDPLLRRMFFEFAADDEQDILKLLHILARHVAQS